MKDQKKPYPILKMEIELTDDVQTNISNAKKMTTVLKKLGIQATKIEYSEKNHCYQRVCTESLDFNELDDGSISVNLNFVSY